MTLKVLQPLPELEARLLIAQSGMPCVLAWRKDTRQPAVDDNLTWRLLTTTWEYDRGMENIRSGQAKIFGVRPYCPV